VMLLHGFPTSSFQYRELIPRLADKYHVLAPDLPGFGFTEVPAERNYQYTFDALAHTVLAFTDALQLKRYALYVFDYGAPTGFRLAMARPERVMAIVSQNGNAYEEGLGDAWAPNHEINKRLGKERQNCSVEEFKVVLDSLDDILQTLVRRLKKAQSEYEKRQA